jgi:hypothetical protein
MKIFFKCNFLLQFLVIKTGPRSGIQIEWSWMQNWMNPDPKLLGELVFLTNGNIWYCNFFYQSLLRSLVTKKFKILVFCSDMDQKGWMLWKNPGRRWESESVFLLWKLGLNVSRVHETSVFLNFGAMSLFWIFSWRDIHYTIFILGLNFACWVSSWAGYKLLRLSRGWGAGRESNRWATSHPKPKSLCTC